MINKQISSRKNITVFKQVAKPNRLQINCLFFDVQAQIYREN